MYVCVCIERGRLPGVRLFNSACKYGWKHHNLASGYRLMPAIMDGTITTLEAKRRHSHRDNREVHQGRIGLNLSLQAAAKLPKLPKSSC